MHKLSPIYVVASVALAVAGTAALAETAAKGSGAKVAKPASGMSTSSTGTVTSSVTLPATKAANTVGSGSNGEGGFVFALPGTSNIDVRNQQTLQATQGTRSSGPTVTAASGTTAAGTAAAATTSAGTTASSSGRTTTVASTSGIGTTTGTTTTGETTAANTLVAPILLNSIVSGGGESDRVFDERDATVATQYAMVNGLTGSVVTVPVATDTARAGVSLDRAIRQAERDRKKIGRNGQLLYSIAPRTNVDRSNEVPDDGPTPALKGLMSR